MLRYPKNKLGVSIMIGYVLLITGTIIMGAVVYKWMESYVPREIIECPDGVSLFIKDFSCKIEGDHYIADLILSNNGRFDVDGYLIKVAESPGQDIATKDISESLTKGGTSSSRIVLFSGGKLLGPGEKASLAEYNLTNEIYLLEITPIKYGVIEGKNRLMICGNSKVKEKISCEVGESPIEFNPLNIEGLVSWWKFEDNVLDEVGNNDGTIMGETNCSANGIKGYGCYFDGNLDYVTIPYDNSLNITHELTLATWVKLANQNQVQPLILKGQFENTFYYLDVTYSNKPKMYKQTAYPSAIYSTTEFSQDQWYYLVGTYDNSELKIYIDGDLDTSLSSSGEIDSNTLGLWFGRQSNGQAGRDYFNGTMDEVMIFNKSLNASQIEELYTYFA